VLAIADNLGNIIAPITVASVNKHDTKLFPTSLSKLEEFAYYQELDIEKSFLTLDPGFDSKENHTLILQANIIPVIKPNLRGLQDQTKRYERLDDFLIVKCIYKERYKIERCFAWEDKYRKVVIRYERLQSTFMGFRHLAYSMINFRWKFGKP
jgi:hypothetical protein